MVLHPTDPGSAGGSSGAGSTSAGGRSSGTRTCTYLGNEIDCTSAEGVWSSERQCFVQRMSPQPALDLAIWDGHADGAIYTCRQPVVGGGRFGVVVGSGTHFWAPDAGSTGAPVLVDPVTLAEEAIDRMRLVGVRPGATPLDPAAPGVVGIQTWLWVDNAGADSFGPITRTATAGSVSVTATAKVTKVVWDMGDGAEVTCRDTGTEWTRADGADDSPTCGHTYLADSRAEPDGAYQVRATTHWTVDWDGAGQSGTIRFTLTGPPRAMPVVELHALRTR